MDQDIKMSETQPGVHVSNGGDGGRITAYANPAKKTAQRACPLHFKFGKVKIMSPTTLTILLLGASLIPSGSTYTGSAVQISYKGGLTVAPEAHEANGGLVTLAGPSGMFINPTSTTLPQGAFTAQYCFFLPDFDFKETMAHRSMFAYGVTD